MIRDMVKNDSYFDRHPAYYGYTANGKIVTMCTTYKKARQFVKTLADMTGKDMYLYSINDMYEIYFVRKIRSCRKGDKK